MFLSVVSLEADYGTEKLYTDVCIGINRWLLPSGFAGIDRRLLLGSTIGSCWDRPSAFAGIDRKLQGELC
jgi:hypothetical protein